MLRLTCFVVLAAVLASCNGGSSGGSQTDWGPEITGPLFTVSPLDVSQIQFVTGQGHLAPSPHTLPTPHVYLYWNFGGGRPLIPVTAPGPGRITLVLDQGGDTKIMVRASPTLTWYLDHILLDPSLRVGSVLTAGAVIGTTSTMSAAIDLGLLDSSVTQPFLAPQRYGPDLLTCVSPWTRFTPALRSFFDSISNVVGPDKDGAVCFDVDGTAAGNWFLDGVPDSRAAEGDPANWPKQLAFAHDETDPGRWRISVGGVICPASLFAIVAVDPAPTAITADAATHVIRLYSNLAEDGTTLPVGWLLVRLETSGTMHVEFVSAVDHPPASAVDTPVTTFTGGERLYRRRQGSDG